MKVDLMRLFNRLVWLFCVLSLVARLFSETLANILLGAELICVVGVIVVLIVGTIRIKKQEKKFKEDLRNRVLEFLKTKDNPNTLEILGESDDIKE